MAKLSLFPTFRHWIANNKELDQRIKWMTEMAYLWICYATEYPGWLVSPDDFNNNGVVLFQWVGVGIAG